MTPRRSAVLTTVAMLAIAGCGDDGRTADESTLATAGTELDRCADRSSTLATSGNYERGRSTRPGSLPSSTTRTSPS